MRRIFLLFTLYSICYMNFASQNKYFSEFDFLNKNGIHKVNDKDLSQFLSILNTGEESLDLFHISENSDGEFIQYSIYKLFPLSKSCYQLKFDLAEFECEMREDSIVLIIQHESIKLIHFNFSYVQMRMIKSREMTFDNSYLLQQNDIYLEGQLIYKIKYLYDSSLYEIDSNKVDITIKIWEKLLDTTMIFFEDDDSRVSLSKTWINCETIELSGNRIMKLKYHSLFSSFVFAIPIGYSNIQVFDHKVLSNSSLYFSMENDPIRGRDNTLNMLGILDNNGNLKNPYSVKYGIMSIICPEAMW